MPYGRIDKRTFLKTAAGVLWGGTGRAQLAAPAATPNIVLICADDLGYGDLGCYGSRIRTPNLDRMAAEGVAFRNYYAGSNVCSPSRAVLMTGRYAPRTGVTGVLFPGDNNGLPESETTLAQTLKSRGYRSLCAGKWHLGSLPRFLPTNRGFDEFYGILYSNDMAPLSLVAGTEVVEPETSAELLTQRCTSEAVRFISRSKDAPFFVFLSLPNTHIPLCPSASFRRKSPLGPYGDVVQELDWSVGEVLKAIADNGLDERTLVMFTSDNGPWYQGSRGNLRGRKGENYEGGVRVPFVARYPGCIPAGLVSSGVASALDILPTLTRLSGAGMPPNPLDGVDIWPLMAGAQGEVERDILLFFDGCNLQCGRLGRWKLHATRYNSIAWTPDPPGGRFNLPLINPELYDVESDPTESYDLAPYNPEVVADMMARMVSLVAAFPEPVPSAWRNTLRTPVEWTPAGALPIRKTG